MYSTCIGSIIERLGKNTSIQEPRCKSKMSMFVCEEPSYYPGTIQRFLEKKSLLMPANTRFVCNFIMIMRMIEVREALENMVMHRKFTEYVATLFNHQNGV